VLRPAKTPREREPETPALGRDLRSASSKLAKDRLREDMANG